MVFNKFNKKIVMLAAFLTVAASLLCESAFALDTRRVVMPNGLVVLYSERHNLPVVKMTLIINASKLDEPERLAGLANLTAVMLTEGAKNRKSKEIHDEIEFAGASIEASTTSDYTAVGLSTLKKDLPKMFEILADCVLNPTFSDAELRQKKELVKGSIKHEDESPAYAANKAFLGAVFVKSPYGRVNEGTPEAIDLIKREDLVKFHDDFYVPSGSILSVAGDVTYDELMELVNKYLSGWAAPAKRQVKQRAVPEQPRPAAKKAILINRDTQQANVILGGIGIKRDNPDFYAVSVMNYILGGGGFASRMVKTIRDDRGLAYDIHSHFASFKYAGIFQVFIQTKNEFANVAITEILKQIKHMKEGTVTNEELADAKAYLTGSFPRKIDTMDKIAIFMAQVEYYGLGIDFDKKYPAIINAITKEDVKRAAQKYLADKNYQLAIAGNQEKIGLSSDYK
ncbi:MAG: insulinase family protein [Candidatus Magnetominusculus sp. LBB02]|nr:insulinase family protein [Candidatus Magnetominusculus sp. LBB02]